MRLDVKIEKAGYKNKPVLENIHFSLCDGSFTAVIGRNGSGKSTLLAALSGRIAYDGSIMLGSRELRDIISRDRARIISGVLQQQRRSHITVRELIAFGRSPYLRIGRKPTETDLASINRAVELADVERILDSYADRISGGELRRAYFAMLLAQDTDIALLDEATAFMDADYERSFLELSKQIAESKTVISVMHNLNFAVEYADNILLLDSGKQLFFGTRDELLETELIEETFSVKRYVSDRKIFFA